MLDRFVPPQAKDYALLIARLVIGIVFIAHGVQKLTEGGVGGTAKGFAMMGIPAPTLSALYAIVVEVGGGVLLLAGALVPLVSVLIILDMAGAFWFVHASKGFFSQTGGYEYVLVLAIVCLVFLATGSGRFGLDAVFARRGDREPEKAAAGQAR